MCISLLIKSTGFILYGVYLIIFLTGHGLRVKTACTQTSDSVCEPLEGFYCSDGYRGSCRYAEEHKKCSPGEYIKQKGWCTVCTFSMPLTFPVALCIFIMGLQDQL